MRAVLAEILGARISGKGRSFNEMLDRVFDRPCLTDTERRDFARMESESADAAAGASFLVGAELLLLVRLSVAAFALRRRRLCVLLIASISSSFFMPCQPEIP